MAEEFALKKGVRNGRTIDRKERLIGAETVMVDRPGDQFFARSAFPPEEGGDIARGNLADHFVDLLHLGRGSDNPFFLSFGHGQGSVSDFFFDQVPQGEGFIHQPFHWGIGKGFRI